MADTITPRQICERIATGLRNKLTLTSAQVYVSAVGGYIEGQDLETVQIVPGGTRPSGDGEGAQDGGGLLREEFIVLWCWFTLHWDMHQMTQEALIKATEGILDKLERIRGVFALTNLGGVTLEPMAWRGTSPVMVQDPEQGILFATITLSAKIGEYLPLEAATLTDDDFT